METNRKFDTKKCLNYINQIEDFEIEFERKPSYDADSGMPVYHAERLSVKAYLKKFIIQCSKESRQEDYDFLQWLSERKLFWKNQQYHVLGSLTDRLMSAQPGDRPFIKKRRGIYTDFFAHITRMIDLIEEDMVNAIDIATFGQFIDTAESAEQMNRKKTGSKLVQQDYALLCALDDVEITTYFSKPSKKLMQHCNAYKDKRKRTEILPEMSNTVAENVRKRYERVITHLKTQDGRQRAQEELVVVCKKIGETHFEK